MNKKQFEAELWKAVQGYWGGDDWKDKRGRSYQWVMDNLAADTDPEQWLIADETLKALRDPDYITGEVPCDTPASPNEWAEDFNTPLDTPVTGYPLPVAAEPEPAPLGWWFCVEDMIPQQMTAEQAWNYTGPFSTEREAWIAVVKQMDDRIDSLVAEIDLIRRRRA